jgi:hypothetical protein
MQFRTITPSTAILFASSATVFIELTSLETTVMAVLRIGVVIYVEEDPLFSSVATKKMLHVYSKNLCTVEHILSFVTNHVRIFGF